MILIALILIPQAGGALAWILGRRGDRWPRWISIAALLLDLILALSLWRGSGRLETGPWLAETILPWFPSLGIGFHLAVDGLSLLLVLLTGVLGILSVACSWNEIQSRVGFFHFNLMLVLSGVLGVFLAVDLFLFYFFWELMLVPLYFLIAIWGHERRIHAAVKFFLFTQASGLLMLVSIVGLAFAHYRATGELTFDRALLIDTPMGPQTAMWLMLGFVAAFFVKMPSIPVHTWLPDAHTEAPTAGSVVLAGLLLEDRCLRDPQIRDPALSGRLPDLRARGHDARCGRNHLRRGPGLRANRLQEAGGLHQREPHGIRDHGHLRRIRHGPSGSGARDPSPRPLDRRALHPGRRASRPDSHP